MKTALVLGGGGFIGSHLVDRLKSDGYWVRAVDIREPEFHRGKYRAADDFRRYDLRDPVLVGKSLELVPHSANDWRPFDEVYQLAADMGGAGYIFTGEHDADIMDNSAKINLNVLRCIVESNQSWNKKGRFRGKVFYSSSACVYPKEIQSDYNNQGLREDDAYPANPDSDYGWEKLFSERLYFAYARNHGIDVRVARFHNVYGPLSPFQGGREKAPAAMCRKVIEPIKIARQKLDIVKATFSGMIIPDVEFEDCIEVWGTGHQTRSFLYIDDCIDAVRKFMQSDFQGPLNIGSEAMVTINQLAQIAIDLSGKSIQIKNIEGPVGVMGRNSNNDLIREKLGWKPKYTLLEGMEKTFNWIRNEMA